MARKGPFKDLGWGKLGGNKKPNTPKKNPGINTRYRTSAMGQLMGQAREAAIPKKAKGGNYAAVVLAVYKDNLSAAAGSSWMTAWYDDILGVPLPETIKIKARIPALHAGIPEPDKYGCGSGKGKHWFWINMHPTFYASSQDIEMPECGDIVIVSVNADDGSGGGDAAGSGLIMKNVVTRENNPVKLGGSCPPKDQFPDAAPSSANGATGDAMGGEAVSAGPVSPFGLPADCDFECMMEFLGGIAPSGPATPGRDVNGNITTGGSPMDKKGVFISRHSMGHRNMPTPLTAVTRSLWADLGYVVLEAIHQTGNRTYKTDYSRLKEYARMFAMGGMNVYISGTPYPGKAAEYVKYMTKVATELPILGMVMTPSWGYLSPGNKDKYARQAKYVTKQMKKASHTHSLQLGFSNSWMPSAEYTVSEAEGEDGEVSIRYKDSFPYYCFSDVDWSIAQILSTSGKSVIKVRESTGAVEIVSEKGSEALKQEDFVEVLNDYMKLGFQYIIPAFGVMGAGWDDYLSTSEKPPNRLKEELDFLGAVEEPAVIGQVRKEDSDPRSMPNPGPGAPGLDVKNWATGYFGSIIECVDEEIGVDRRCELPPAPVVVEDPPPIEETITELVEVPVMEWTDGWADYTMGEDGIITYISPMSGDPVNVSSDNTSNIYPGGCPDDCYDAIMGHRPESTWVEQEIVITADDIEETDADEVTSQIWPTFPKPNPPIKAQVMWSTMWWDWLNAEENTPCWRSQRWEIIKNFHRYSPIAYERQQEGGAINPGNFEQFSAEIRKAMEAIERYNRIAEGNPGMHKVSLDQYVNAVQQAQSMGTFSDASDMESYAEAASSVAQNAATELGYDGEGSASGRGTDTDSGLEDEVADADAYYGSDEEAPDSGGASAGGTGLDAYPAFPYIQFSSPITGGNQGGWFPAVTGAFRASTRSPSSIDHIVIHTTAGASQLAGGEVFCRPGAGVSTHYGINTGGFIYQFVKESDIAYGNGGGTRNAAPPSSQGGRRNLGGGTDKYVDNSNGTGISIEITGIPKEEAEQPGKWYTDVMYENLAFLVANICKRNQIAVDRTHIFGHDEMTMRKSDPGTLLQAEHPAGISYPYGGIASDGSNKGPSGGEAFPGARFQINSYSPNSQGNETFDWAKFMGLVEGFFAGAGVPTPPSSALAVGSASVAPGGASASAAAPEQCDGSGGAGGGAAGGGGSAGGAPLSAAQIAALGEFQGNWPSGGSPAFSSDFGPRSPPSTSGGQGSSNHPGIDTISLDPASYNNPGTIPLFAVANGTVTRVRDMSDSAGKFVDVTHDDGMTSQYMHCHTIQVTNGQRVNAGDVVATMGTTGNSSGVHLHYSLWTGASYDSSKVDPASALGLECNSAAKGHSRYGRLCAPGNQNMDPGGPYTG